MYLLQRSYIISENNSLYDVTIIVVVTLIRNYHSADVIDGVQTLKKIEVC